MFFILNICGSNTFRIDIATQGFGISFDMEYTYKYIGEWEDSEAKSNHKCRVNFN